MILDILFCLAGLVWLRMTVTVLRGSECLRDLEPLDATTGGTQSSICVIVAVRDGAGEIGATIDGLLAQRDVDLRIVAVDDRSTDATGTILAERAARDPRLTVLRIEALQDGWLGKPHACWQAVAIAPASDWLLFVDADTRLSPHTLVRAATAAQRDGAVRFCLVPRLDGQTPIGRAIGILFCFGLFERALDVARRHRRRTMGVGAFTLVRRAEYLAVGGHEAVRMQVVEDMELARRMLVAGHRTALRMAVDEFGVHWITDLRSVFTVLQKNYFALFRYRLALVLLAGSALFALWALAIAGPVAGRATGWFAGAGLASLLLPALVIGRRYHLAPRYAFATPWCVPLIVASLFYSTFVTLRDGGVRWRETFYPLTQLRAAGRTR